MSKKGFKHSEEAIQKMRDARAKQIPPMLGKKHSKESIKKMSEAKIGKKRKPFSEEWIQNIIESRKGYKHSKETKDKIAEAHTGVKRKPFTDEARKNMSEAHSGSKSSFWRGGKTPYPVGWTKHFKKSIRKRYKFVCQMCNKNGYCVHHINYIKDDLSFDNLIVLCPSCHMKTNFNREYWQEYFQKRTIIEKLCRTITHISNSIS